MVVKKEVQNKGRQDENCLKVAQQGNLENNSQWVSALEPFFQMLFCYSSVTVAGVSS